jgi:uncharacterized protein (TIGR00255 family)
MPRNGVGSRLWRVVAGVGDGYKNSQAKILQGDRQNVAGNLNSMTGFARAEGGTEACTWVWEVKSVNAKGLDVRSRLAGGFDGLEAAVRERAQARFKRGNISVFLQINRARPLGAYRINAEALEAVRAALPGIAEMFPDSAPPTQDGLLALKGVMEAADEELDEDAKAALEAALLADLDKALDGLAEARAGEGRHLAEVIGGQLSTIVNLRATAEGLAAAQPDAIKARLAQQVRELADAVPAMPEDRLAQEAALLMLKADIREELDRLRAHCEAAAGLLSESGAVGRRMDFLCQEFNREANTVCSKSADIELTNVE